MRAICVYCGARTGSDPAFAAATERLADELVARDLHVVFGGGRVGLMGVLADRVLARGGRITGVIPEHLRRAEVAHDGLTELVVTRDMHERKATMAARADAFVALPGGLGTLEELFETWTWGQLGLHDKPLGLFDVGGYFAPLVAFLDHAVERGFVNATHRAMLHVAAEPGALLDRLAGC